MRIDDIMAKHIKGQDPNIMAALLDVGRLCREFEIENLKLKGQIPSGLERSLIKSLKQERDELNKEVEQLRRGQDPLTKGLEKEINTSLRQRVKELVSQNINLMAEIESLKKEKEFPTKVDTPSHIKFSTTDEWKITGIVRGEYALTKSNKMYDVGMHARETTNVLLEKVCREDLKPGDIIFDDELSTEQLSDIENYGIILENMSVAFWSGLGVIVEPNVETVTGQYYKVVIKK